MLLKRTVSLWWGWVGTGKTRALSTCPGKGLVAEFDPDGAQVLWPEVQGGKVDVEEFREDDPYHPHAASDFMKWLYQKAIPAVADGTYEFFSLDSLSGLMDSLAFKATYEQGHPGEGMDVKQGDYQLYYAKLGVVLTTVAALDCHVVMTAHAKVYQDWKKKGQPERKSAIVPSFIGTQAAQKVMRLCREIYYAYRVGDKFMWQTNPSSTTEFARTSMGYGAFNREEPQDFAALLEKVEQYRKGKGNGRP